QVRELIARLLDPVDGYRSARGVLHDLSICLAACRRGGSIGSFALGTRDVRGQFTASSVIRGRERELDHFEAMARQVGATGSGLAFPVIPELGGLIGDQPAAALIPPVESAARFGETLKRLLVACAAHVELLVVVLDDMQWCDHASVRLICSLLGDREVGHML